MQFFWSTNTLLGDSDPNFKIEWCCIGQHCRIIASMRFSTSKTLTFVILDSEVSKGNFLRVRWAPAWLQSQWNLRRFREDQTLQNRKIFICFLWFRSLRGSESASFRSLEFLSWGCESARACEPQLSASEPTIWELCIFGTLIIFY